MLVPPQLEQENYYQSYSSALVTKDFLLYIIYTVVVKSALGGRTKYIYIQIKTEKGWLWLCVTMLVKKTAALKEIPAPPGP